MEVIVVLDLRAIRRQDVSYVWKITNLEMSDDNTVKTVFWFCEGKFLNTESGIEYSSIRDGELNVMLLDLPEDYKFIQFNDLTEEVCLSWLSFHPNFVDQQVEAEIAKSITKQIRPSLLTKVPWEK